MDNYNLLGLSRKEIMIMRIKEKNGIIMLS